MRKDCDDADTDAEADVVGSPVLFLLVSSKYRRCHWSDKSGEPVRRLEHLAEGDYHGREKSSVENLMTLCRFLLCEVRRLQGSCILQRKAQRYCWRQFLSVF